MGLRKGTSSVESTSDSCGRVSTDCRSSDAKDAWYDIKECSPDMLDAGREVVTIDCSDGGLRASPFLLAAVCTRLTELELFEAVPPNDVAELMSVKLKAPMAVP